MGQVINMFRSERPGTTIRKQFVGIKNKYPDTILIFKRNGFYEAFFEDAVIVSKIFGIGFIYDRSLDGKEFPIYQIPSNQIEPYILMMVGTGHKVAICEPQPETRE